jgi:hypothetical protein
MHRADGLRPRPGAALVFALLLLVVLDCVIIGTLHLAILERRTADNATAALRLRIAAESIVRAAIAQWPSVDTLRVGMLLDAAHAITAEGYVQHASIERVGADLFFVRGVAENPAGSGRASALLMVTSPAFPPAANFAAAAVSGRAAIHVSGSVAAAAAAECPNNPSIALRVTSLDLLSVSPDALQGDVAYFPPGDDYSVLIPAAIARLRGHSGTDLRIVTGDLRLDTGFDGVLIVDGSLTLAPGVVVTGLILVSGGVTIEPGAAVHGALQAGADARILGAVTLDACAVEAVAGRTRLTVPRPAPTRGWLPAF